MEERRSEISHVGIDLVATGKKLKDIRLKHKLSIETLQKLLGFDYPQSIYRWEAGTNLPSIEHLYDLSQIYQIPVADLLVVHNYELAQRAFSIDLTEAIKRKPELERRIAEINLKEAYLAELNKGN